MVRPLGPDGRAEVDVGTTEMPDPGPNAMPVTDARRIGTLPSEDERSTLGDPGGRMRDGEEPFTEPSVTARWEVVRGAEVVAGANPRDHARPCYMTSKASYTVTLPPPCRTGELFASEVAESSESAWRIV
jgi:hypothetical protein